MEKSIKNKEFHSDMDRIFAAYLSEGSRPQVMIKDKKSGKIIEDMNYSKVFFDTNLNIYKTNKDGNIEKVNNSNFEAVVVKQK